MPAYYTIPLIVRLEDPEEVTLEDLAEYLDEAPEGMHIRLSPIGTAEAEPEDFEDTLPCSEIPLG